MMTSYCLLQLKDSDHGEGVEKVLMHHYNHDWQHINEQMDNGQGKGEEEEEEKKEEDAPSSVYTPSASLHGHPTKGWQNSSPPQNEQERRDQERSNHQISTDTGSSRVGVVVEGLSNFLALGPEMEDSSSEVVLDNAARTELQVNGSEEDDDDAMFSMWLATLETVSRLGDDDSELSVRSIETTTDSSFDVGASSEDGIDKVSSSHQNPRSLLSRSFSYEFDSDAFRGSGLRTVYSEGDLAFVQRIKGLILPSHHTSSVSVGASYCDSSQNIMESDASVSNLTMDESSKTQDNPKLKEQKSLQSPARSISPQNSSLEEDSSSSKLGEAQHCLSRRKRLSTETIHAFSRIALKAAQTIKSQRQITLDGCDDASSSCETPMEMDRVLYSGMGEEEDDDDDDDDDDDSIFQFSSSFTKLYGEKLPPPPLEEPLSEDDSLPSLKDLPRPEQQRNTATASEQWVGHFSFTATILIVLAMLATTTTTTTTMTTTTAGMIFGGDYAWSHQRISPTMPGNTMFLVDTTASTTTTTTTQQPSLEMRHLLQAVDAMDF